MSNVYQSQNGKIIEKIARSPRVESRAKPIEEVIQPQPSSDEIVQAMTNLKKLNKKIQN